MLETRGLFAKYCLLHRALLQKRHTILRSLLIVATPLSSNRGQPCGNQLEVLKSRLATPFVIENIYRTDFRETLPGVL